MKRYGFSAVLAVAAVLLAALSSTLHGAPVAGARRIVVFRSGASTPAGREAAIARVGGALLRDLAIVNGASAVLPPAAEQALLRRGDILRIDPDLEVFAIAKPDKTPGGGGGDTSAPPEVLPWGVDRIDAELAWAGATGAGIKVAVVDTGIDYDHPDLKPNYFGGVNITSSRKPPKDDNGHGTHVAGTIAAADNNIGVVGVAPRARLYAVKVLSRSGSGWISDIIAGLEWCAANNMDVANMSLGLGTYVKSFDDACQAASDAGVILVAAAGNDGGAVGYPAAFASVIAVSATTSSDKLPSWSSRGPEVDFAAPGVNILSTLSGGGYGTMSGTSMASPHVAGVVALVLENPGALTPEWITSLTADEQGVGLIDAEASVKAPPAP